MIALLAGCAKIEEVDQPIEDQPQTEIETPDTGLPEVIYAGFADEESEDPKTRTFVNDDSNVLWNQNDDISYFTGTEHLHYAYIGEDGASKAEFYLCNDTDNDLDYKIRGTAGLYPFNHEATCYDMGIAPEGVVPPCIHQIVTEFPSEQTYAENSFGKEANIMVASSEQENETNLYFRNACGYLIIKLYAEEETNIKSIKLEAFNDVKIAGRVFINASSDEAPKVVMDSDNSSSVVTLDCCSWDNGVALGTTKETATEFWFALPPGTIEGGIKITATDTDNNVFVKETTKDVTITRNQIQPMAALEFKNNGTGDYRLIYTRPEEKTAPYDFGGNRADENLQYFDQYITKHYYDSNSKRFVIQFDEPLTEIKEEAFYEKDLTSIIFPDSLTKIGKIAFNRCGNLERIIFPGNLESIEIHAFTNCWNLKTLIFLPSPTNTNLKINTDGKEGGFGTSNLDTLHLNRELVHLSNGKPFVPSRCKEGLFCYYKCHYDPVGTHWYTFDEIVLGNQVKTLHSFMFHRSRIKSITIPSSVTSMSNFSFEGCVNLESVIFEESSEPLTVEFYISSLDMHDDVGPCHDSQNLKTVVLNRELRLSENYQRRLDDVEEGLFSDIKSLTDITLGPNVKTIHDYMFSNLPIESLTIPNTVTSIGNNAFQGCTALPSITIPGSVTSIGNDAFRDCTALTSFTIPSSVTSIGSDAFHACTALESLTFESGTADLRIGPSFEASDEYGPFYDSKNLTTLKLDRNLVPDYGIDADEEGFFSEIPSLKHVTLGKNVKTIGNRMFLGTGITGITIPSSVTTIENDAFCECTALTSITIPSSVNLIKVDAFYNCEKLKSITFDQGDTPLKISRAIAPDGTSDLSPFYYSPLETITVNRELKYVDTDGSDFTPDYWDEGLFVHKYYDSIDELTVNLGGSFKTISRYMFNSMPIKEITIPSSVTMIDNFAFDDCTKLSRIIFSPGSNNLTIGFQPHSNEKGPFFDSPLTYIKLDRSLVLTAEYANALDAWDEGIFAYDYWDDDSLTTTVSLGDNVTYISKYMFSCVRMTGCWIPKNVTMIDEGAFYYCRQLQSLSLGCTTPPALGEDVFKDCDAFYQINVPYRYQDTYKAHSQWKEVIKDHELYVYYWAGSESL